MKKLIIVFVLTIALFSCIKETTNSTTNSNITNNNAVVCVDNPDINFTSIDSPIGKLDSCIKDVEGNVYKTVTIGTQTWMSENLKTSKYSDGNPIPYVVDSAKWNHLTTGAWCYPNKDKNTNVSYGKLYNWFVVNPKTNGYKNVCPNGWHVPSIVEWGVLAELLGGQYVPSASGAIHKMKEVGTTHWKNSDSNKLSTNSSLFTALPAGGRFSIGFDDIGQYTYWWTADEETYNFPPRSEGVFYNTIPTSENYTQIKTSGLSIRCIKDTLKNN